MDPANRLPFGPEVTGCCERETRSRPNPWEAQVSNPKHGRGINSPPTATVATVVARDVVRELDRIARAEHVSRGRLIREAVLHDLARRREAADAPSS